MAVERADKVTDHAYEHTTVEGTTTSLHRVLCRSDSPRVHPALTLNLEPET